MANLTMITAIEALGLQHIYEIRPHSGNYTCPECGKKKKLNINFDKDIFHCPACDFGGAAFDFWAYYRGLDVRRGDEAFVKTVSSDWYRYIGEDTAVKCKVENARPKEASYHEEDLADSETLNKTYRAFLDELILSDKHKANLLERGLGEEDILAGGYKSMPTLSTAPICHKLMSAGVRLEGVPGFYKKNNEWHFVQYLGKNGTGFLIPSKDVYGNIQGLQLRVDNTRMTRKDETLELPRYLTISSAERDFGTKGTTRPHVNLGKKKTNKIILTEGPLKANIISAFTGLPTIAVLGVNSIKHLTQPLSQLRALGYNSIAIAYDMDMWQNENVQAAYAKLKGLLNSMAFRYSTYYWDIEKGKGLDDFLKTSMPK